MTRRCLFLMLLVMITGGLTPPARLAAQPKKKGGPLSPEEAYKALQVADGFQVELFAHEPMLINPTTIDVDHKGRVWVCEAVNYRRKAFGRPIIRPEGDRIVVLIDGKGEGKATEAKTFYQSPEIVAPLGVCVAPYADGKGQKVYVCHSPDILVFEDKDGDLKADGPPKKLLTGFRGFDHDHGVHGINIGPDGKLYFTVGDAGVGNLQSSDGKGKKWTSNDTDVQKGTVWRCDMDGTNLELIAHNFRNNYECCVDSFGEIWLSDNDDDGNQQTRICFVFPGGNFGYGPRGPGQTHWHEEQPGIVHKTMRTGFGSPTGITFNEGSLFPAKYRGSLLHCDAGPREVRWFHRKPKGAGYELEKELLLTSKDNWFRPSDVCIAPDSSIFVSDWYDRGVGGHGMGDPTDGRIYRITPKGHKGYKVPEVNPTTKEGALKGIRNPNLAVRAATFAHLFAIPHPTTREYFAAGIADTTDPLLQARCHQAHVRLMETSKTVSEEMPIAVPTRPDTRELLFAHEVRLRSSRIFEEGASAVFVGRVRRQVESGQITAASRELLLTLRHIRAKSDYVTDFYALAKLYDGQDHFYRAALNIACGTDPARRDAILADFDMHFPEWNDKVADLVWELRPKSVLPRLGKLLTDAKLTVAQKARIVDIIAANEDIAAGRTMLEVVRGDAAREVKTRALESLKLFIPTKWKGLQGSKELNAAIDELLKDKQTQATALQLIAAARAVDRVEAVLKLAEILLNDEWISLQAIETLGQLKCPESVAKLRGEARRGTVNPEPTASVASAIHGLSSMITGQPKDEVGAKAMEALQELVATKPLGGWHPRRILAMQALAGTRPGTIWLLDLHQKGELPKELVEQAGRLLRNSPFQGERNRALLLFPAPGKLNPKNLPAVAELAKRTGDAARGKAVWTASLTGASQCSKCHMVRGVGGQIGPDLSMIGKKSAREALYESILIPSKAIADQYIQHQVTTAAEVTVSGLLVADTPESITLRDANGKDTTIAKKDLAGEPRKLKISLMSEDVVAALTEEELVDLVAYLETLKVAALTPDSFHIMGPFVGKSMEDALDEQYGPEKYPFRQGAMFSERPVKPGEIVPAVEWKTIRPDGKGYFDLAALHGKAAANSASYLYVEVESPVEQAADVLLGTDDGARLWVNGKEVFTTRATRAAAPEQEKIAVKLVKGKNTVMLKVANGNIPHGFYFSLTSAEETKVAGKK